MKEQYQSIYNLIKDYDVIIIHRHSRPDGDALGSQIGLKEAIKASFKDKEVYVVGDETNRYSFIGKMDEVADEKYNNALVFLLDASDSGLISDERYKKASKKIKIDHHIFKEEYGDIELVDNSFESCCGLIAEFIFETGLTLSKEGAKALYTGMVTDSGRFRYDSTTSKTFMIASKLMEYNFDINEVYNNLYVEDLAMVKLRALFTSKFQITDWNVAYIKTTKEEVKELNVDIFSISRGMVNTMSGIRGIDIWANFTEDENNGVIVELRSSKYDINAIAVKYGGGGHPKACGCTVKSFEEVDMIINDLNNVCKNKGVISGE